MSFLQRTLRTLNKTNVAARPVFATRFPVRYMSAAPKITAGMVKQLREATGASMMECKKALTTVSKEVGEGDDVVQLAQDFLRKSGTAAAAKRAGRATSEGLVGLLASDTKAILLEVNCETDFVARNETFRKFLEDGLTAANTLDYPTVETLMAAPAPSGDGTVADLLTNALLVLKENITVSRVQAVTVPEGGRVGSYMHGQDPDYKSDAFKLGRIGCVVALDNANADHASDESTDCTDFAGKLAMHVAAANPKFLDESAVPQDALDKEVSILTEQALAAGKPEKMIERIVSGRVGKYYEENCLANQRFLVMTDDVSGKAPTVRELANKVGATLSGFQRFQVGSA